MTGFCQVHVCYGTWENALQKREGEQCSPGTRDRGELISAIFYSEGFPLRTCSAELRIIIVTWDQLLPN